ncbi:MAG: PcfJ domain-containing protein [Gemmataceae bacterium]|nr:PcfJ domain-containing protein [Gemmataceae bacterium]
MRRDGTFRRSAQRRLDDSIRAARALLAPKGGALPAYERLLAHVRARTSLLRPSDRPGGDRTPFNRGLAALSLYHADWLRPVEAWRSAARNPWPLFSSLAQHLLARCPVPACMASAWLDPPTGRKSPQQDWFRHLGRGMDLRTAGLPLRLTRAMARLFWEAPHHYPVIAAVRWAQVLGLGGSKELARAVVGTRLGKTLENEEFWETVLRFFVSHPELALEQVGPVVDFLHAQRFAWKEGVSPQGVFGKRPPPRPDYSMKGRTVASVLRQVEEWHRELIREADRPLIAWRPAPFGGFRLVRAEESGAQVWTIEEILTDRDLRQEGREMRHCVASYLEECVRRETSIWTMRVETRWGQRRALTLEVDIPTRMIWQARGTCNRPPSANELGIVERWAEAEGLRLAEEVRA